MVTERQKELAGWFEKQIADWKGYKLHPDGSLSDTNPYCLGPWLDADWCGEFFNKFTKVNNDLFVSVAFSIPMVTHVSIEAGDKSAIFKAEDLTEQLQEAVRQAIIWMPKESETVIKGMNE